MQTRRLVGRGRRIFRRIFNRPRKKSAPMISSWVREREFKKLKLIIIKIELDVD